MFNYFMKKENGLVVIMHYTCIDKTTGRDSSRMIAYSPANQPEDIFVMDRDEFELLFDPMTSKRWYSMKVNPY